MCYNLLGNRNGDGAPTLEQVKIVVGYLRGYLKHCLVLDGYVSATRGVYIIDKNHVCKPQPKIPPSATVGAPSPIPLANRPARTYRTQAGLLLICKDEFRRELPPSQHPSNLTLREATQPWLFE